MAIDAEQEVGPGAKPPRKKAGLPGTGLIKGLGVTLKHMLQPSITQEYPDEKPDLPPRTRGVIALKQENCTVCWKCSRECPDWRSEERRVGKERRRGWGPGRGRKKR